MGTIFAYSLAVSTVLMAVWAGYGCLRGGTPASRRAILVSGYLIALIVPLTIPLFETITEETEVIITATTHPVAMPDALPEATATFTGESSALQTILLVYIAGVAATLALTLLDAARVARICIGATKQKFRDRTVYVSRRSDLRPFSFGRFITIGPEDSENEAILEHEAAHLRRHHSSDMLLMQAVAILCWYCPAVWLLRRRLQLEHEFQADNDVINSGTEIREYSMLLVRHASANRLTNIASSFGQSNLKRRIMMLTQPRKIPRPPKNLIPIVAITAAALSGVLPAIGATLDKVSKTELPGSNRAETQLTQKFVVYGCEVPDDGNFVEFDSFIGSQTQPEDIDDIVLSKAGAILISDKGPLKRMTSDVLKFLVDGKMMTPKEFYAEEWNNVIKVVVSGRVAIVHTSTYYRYGNYGNHLQNAIDANK